MSGVILSVYMRNLRIHANSTADFGPRLNFLLGPNGSGKSTILTAVRLALGQPVSGTAVGAADGIDPIIRHGAPANDRRATVRLTLSNEGDNAYRPAALGSKIVVERHISRTASGQARSVYSVLNGDTGRPLALEREETPKRVVDELKAHFGLRADNPLVVMDQDTCKRFVSVDPSALFSLWMECTGLVGLFHEIKQTHKRLAESKQGVESAEATLRTLKQERNEAERAHKRVNALRGFQDEIAGLQRSIVWARALEKVRAGEALAAEAAKAQATAEAAGSMDRRVADLLEQERQKLGAAEERCLAAEDRRRALEAEQQHLRADVEAANTTALRLEANRRAIAEAGAKAQQRLQLAQRELASFEAEAARSDGASKRRARAERIAAAAARVGESTARLQAAAEQVGQVQQRIEPLRRGVDEARRAADDAEAELRAASHRLASIRAGDAERDPFAALGPARAQYDDLRTRVIEQGWTQRRFKTKPMGPLFPHVRCDPRWARAFQSVANNVLLATLVDTQPGDAPALEGLLRANGLGRLSWIRKRHSLPRYPESGFYRPPPDSGLVRLIDVIQVDDAWAFNAIVDATDADRVILAADIPDALDKIGVRRGDRVVGNIPQVKYALLPDGRRVTCTSTGETVRAGNTDWNTGILVRAPSAVQQLEAAVEAEAAARAERDQRREQHRQAEAFLRNLLPSEQQAANERTHADRALRLAEQQLRQAEAEPAPPDDDDDAVEMRRQGFVFQVRTREDEVAASRGQLEEAVRVLAEQQGVVRGLQTQLEAALASPELRALDEAEAVRDQAAARVAKAQEAQQKMQAKVRDSKAAAEGLQARVEAHSREVEAAVAAAREATGLEAPDRTESVAELEALAAGKRRALEAEASRRQIDLAEADAIRQRFEAAEKAYLACKQKYDVLAAARRAARDLHKDTLASFLAARDLSVADTRREFMWLVGERGHRAKITFVFHKNSYDKGMIKIRAAPDFKQRYGHSVREAIASQGLTQAEALDSILQDVGSLSGGEKSYMGIMLMCAIARVAPSPFRIIDEFDVFQDESTRGTTVSLIQSLASRPDRNGRYGQIILLTPLDVRGLLSMQRQQADRIEDAEARREKMAELDSIKVLQLKKD
jgi:chromosome segregation ATPase